MHAIKDVIGYALLEISIIILEFFLYYSRGQTVGPLIVGGILALVVLVITILALFESIKHRNDKELW
jgi:membrane protein YdbS with pleckstrin-like domain